MADLPKVSPEGAQEPVAAPLPSVTSSASAGEPRSAADVSEKILTELVALGARIGKLEDRDPADPEVLEKLVQKYADRRLHKVEMLDPDDIKIVASAFRASGVDAEKIALALGQEPSPAKPAAARQPEPDSQNPRASSTDTPGKVTEEKMKAKALKQLSKSGLSDEQQAQVYSEWGQKSFSAASEEEAWDEAFSDLTALAIAASRLAPKPAVGGEVPEPAVDETLGVGTALPSGVGRPTASAADKASEVDNLYGALGDLYKEPTKNKAEILKTEARLRELGEAINTAPTF